MQKISSCHIRKCLQSQRETGVPLALKFWLTTAAVSCMISALNVTKMISCYDKCAEWPQNDLEHYEVKGRLYMYYLCYYNPSRTNFSTFCSMNSSFWHWILRGQVSNYLLHVYVLLVSLSPKFQPPSIAEWSDVLDLLTTLKQAKRMTPKWPWTLTGEGCLMKILSVPPSPSLQPVLHYVQPLFSYRPFW